MIKKKAKIPSSVKNKIRIIRLIHQMNKIVIFQIILRKAKKKAFSLTTVVSVMHQLKRFHQTK